MFPPTKSIMALAPTSYPGRFSLALEAGQGKVPWGRGCVSSIINAKTGPFPIQDKRYNLNSVLVTIRRWSWGRLDTSPHTLRSAAVFFPFFSGEREIWRRHIRRAQSQDRTSLDQIYRNIVDPDPNAKNQKLKIKLKYIERNLPFCSTLIRQYMRDQDQKWIFRAL